MTIKKAVLIGTLTAALVGFSACAIAKNKNKPFYLMTNAESTETLLYTWNNQLKMHHYYNEDNEESYIWDQSTLKYYQVTTPGLAPIYNFTLDLEFYFTYTRTINNTIQTITCKNNENTNFTAYLDIIDNDHIINRNEKIWLRYNAITDRKSVV